MNLDRISIKVVNRESVFLTLDKISDFRKLYTTILFDQDLSMQKINTGESILAFNFKNIEQFKGFRPFKTFSQEELLDLYKVYGTSFLYQTKLHLGDLVRYNGLKYIVLGIVVNTYAQWNMPTPLLFNPTNINNDFKSLFGSRLTDEQIVKKINDNFQAGKYDADMVIPLVDANDFSEYITIIQPRPTKEEVELMFDSIKAEKDLTIKSQKDVFIDTMLRLRGNEINQIKEVNEDLFKGVQTLLLSVNKAVNEQIELLPEPVIEKPARKPKEKKVLEEFIEEVEPVVELPKAPEVTYQEVKRVDIILYPPEGGVLEIKTDGLYELFEVCRFILTKYKASKRKFNFYLITDYASHTTELYFGGEDSPNELLRSLIEKYDKFGYFNWINFEERQADIDKIKLNEEIIDDAFKPEPKPVEVEKKPFFAPPPKPVEVEKPKPVSDKYTATAFEGKAIKHTLSDSTFSDEIELFVRENEKKGYEVYVDLYSKGKLARQVYKTKKPVPVAKPKPVKVEKPKPVKVEKPKPVKVTKPKVTKPKVEDDLSFLDDLDNIF
jgi:hypothetical protein